MTATWIRLYAPGIGRWAGRTAGVTLALFIVVATFASDEGRLPMPTGLLFLNVAVVLLAEPFLLLAHELGHALVAQVVGLRLHTVNVGTGAALFSFRLGGAPVRLNCVPGSGLTVTTHKSARWRRSRLALMVAAGPATSLLCWSALHGLAVAVHGSRSLVDLLLQPMPLEAAAFCAAVHTVLNLMPVSSNGSAGAIPRDGLRLLQLPFMRCAAFAEAEAADRLLQVQGHFHDGDREAARREVEAMVGTAAGWWLLMVGRLLSASRAGDYGRARDLALEMLRRPALAKRQEALAANSLAWSDFMLADQGLLAEADQRSEQALRLFPRDSRIQGTRAAVLIWSGRLEEGRALSLRALRAHLERSDRAEEAAVLALAEAKMGHAAEARRWLAFARHQGTESQVLGRAEQALAA
jgi:hypothetical protein